MANKIIPGRDGSATLISDSFAPFGHIPVAPEPAENPDRWHPKRSSLAETSKRYGKATAHELLTEWRARFNFPAPSRTILRTAVGTWKTTTEYEWDIDKLDEWDASVRGIAARLPKR